MQFRSLFSLALGSLVLASASAQLRVATYNVTTYYGDRIPEFQTIFYGTYLGRQFAPDIILGQEFASDATAQTFLTMLNTAPGSPGDWARVPFENGPDWDNTAFYRTSKVTHLGTLIAAPGSTNTSDQPRNTMLHEFRLVGYASNSAVLACYNSHMKASSTASDQARRLIEANRIVADTVTQLTTRRPGSNILFAGDTNMQNSSQTAYQALITGTWGTRPFVDPINTPGSWENNSSFKFVHTQDPAATGQMDSRFDVVMLGSTLVDGAGMDYIGNSSTPYSTTTWNDPNHSYRCWGNDGSSFNATINVSGNAMVGPTIAAALQSTALSTGHLPVYLDMKVPAKISLPSSQTIDLGTLQYMSIPRKTISIAHAGDVAKWHAAGLQNLVFNASAVSNLTIPTGPKSVVPGGSFAFTIKPQTNHLGTFSRTISMTTNDPDKPTVTLTIKWRVFRGYGWPILPSPIEGPRI